MFTWESKASEGDVDGLGHVSNLVFVRWVQEAAVAHSAHLGWDLEAYKRRGLVFVVRRHEIDYLAPAFAGDVVRATTWVSDWESASSVRQTRIKRAADGRELARAATQWVLVSLDSGRPKRIPEELRKAFGAA